MPDLDITASDANAYDVTITADDGSTTEHRVQVTEDLLARLGLTPAQEPALVRGTMLYLLDRLPASSLGADIVLDEVARTFPRYADEITAWV